MKKIVLVLIVVLTLIGCSQNEGFDVVPDSKMDINNDVTIKELIYDTHKMTDRFSSFNEADLENGIYMFNTSETTSFILFYSKVVSYSDFSFDIEDEVLKIRYRSNDGEDIGKNSFFIMEKLDEKSYDTIDLENNGKSDHFNIVFVF